MSAHYIKSSPQIFFNFIGKPVCYVTESYKFSPIYCSQNFWSHYTSSFIVVCHSFLSARTLQSCFIVIAISANLSRSRNFVVHNHQFHKCLHQMNCYLSIMDQFWYAYNVFFKNVIRLILSNLFFKPLVLVV